MAEEALKLPSVGQSRKFTLSTTLGTKEKPKEKAPPVLEQFGLSAPTCAEDLREESPVVDTVQEKKIPSDDELKLPQKQGRSLSIWERIMSGPEERAPDGSILPRRRFRKLARMIKMNVVWARDMGEKQEDENTDAFVVKATDKTLVFDKEMYKVKARSYGGLSNRARRILAKAPMERTTEELLMLKDVVDRLKCFDKYPRKVKQELARVICYETYDKGRVIIQQGHVGQSFYFIISGHVQVYITDIDKVTGFRKQQTVGGLTEGSSFGELALMHNIKRTATIVCQEDNSEFLRVDKQDFETVLRVSHENEQNERLRILKSLQTTKGWDEAALLQLNNHCKLKEFLPNKVVYGNTKSVPDMVTFIVSGKCRLVRELDVVRVIHEYGQQSFHLPSEKYLKPQLEKRRGATKGKTHMVERHLWTIGTIGRGHFFGLGEDMTDTYIVSKNRVECLFVPRVQFMRAGHTRVLEQMKEDIDSAIPKDRELFKLYFSECNWDRFKQGLIKDLVRDKPRRTSTTLYDVPAVIRMDSLRRLGNAKGYLES